MHVYSDIVKKSSKYAWPPFPPLERNPKLASPPLPLVRKYQKLANPPGVNYHIVIALLIKMLKKLSIDEYLKSLCQWVTSFKIKFSIWRNEMSGSLSNICFDNPYQVVLSV